MEVAEENRLGNRYSIRDDSSINRKDTKMDWVVSDVDFRRCKIDNILAL